MAHDIEEIRENFESFDRDGNGRIDRREFAELMGTFEGDWSEEVLDIGFAQADDDKDGTIDFDEFLHWFRSQWTD